MADNKPKVEVKVPEVKVPETVAKSRTRADVMAELSKALATNDYKSVSKLSAEVVKLDQADAKAAEDARAKAQTALLGHVRAAIISVLQPMYAKGELDKCDGIWFAWDFSQADNLISVRLSKKAETKPRVAGETKTYAKGGAGWAELSAKHGDEAAPEFKWKDKAYTGTWKQIHDAESDGNFRFKVLEKMRAAFPG